MSKRFEVICANEIPQDIRDSGWQWLADDAEEELFWCIIDNQKKTIVGWDGGEPEDQILVRDFDWVVHALNEVDSEKY